MSYCRFENTLNDLRDCFNALQEEGLETLDSKYEVDGAEGLYHCAKKFIRLYDSLKAEAAAVEDGLIYDE
jgi:hypothetical protein